MDFVIIVAGGSGKRMGTEVPKQFLPVCGRPILMRTIERFVESGEPLKIILVLPKDEQNYWHELCVKYDFNVEHTIVDGGKTRFESSLNGINAIPDDEIGVCGIHDGVRPLVSCDVIRDVYDAAREDFAAIPVINVTSTLRHVDAQGGGHNVDRGDYREVQTPQVFDISLLKRAYQQSYRAEFTDDASVVEALGCSVTMVDGNRENIKITTPFDLKVAESIING
jgi:2-C-methyl-D-erythritol 4-phosphate cytidylyltransferase